MNQYIDLYNFIDLAKTNRKYPENTANGLKSALKIFEKVLNLDELNSIDTVEENIEEIFINAVAKNKDKNIGSMNTYKARLLKVIKDYQKYGINPSKMQGWIIKNRKVTIHRNLKPDNTDKQQDNSEIALSNDVNTPVHKVELSLRHNHKSLIIIPRDITAKEAEIIKTIVDSLASK
jgi:site-specific recombinase XerD